MQSMYVIDISFLAVLFGGLSSVVIGVVWYSRALFGTMWMRGVSMSPEQLSWRHKRMPLFALGAFIASLVLSLVIGILVSTLGIMYLYDALLFASALWAGIIVPPLLAPVLWEGRNVAVFAINAGYWLFVVWSITAIMFFWG